MTMWRVKVMYLELYLVNQLYKIMFNTKYERD